MSVEPEVIEPTESLPSHAVAIQETRPGFLSLEPEAMIDYAVRVANVLKDVIKKQKLTINMQGKEYVKVEGWITLGSLLGILPKEDYVHKLEDGSFEVGISLVRQNDGKILSSASALCGTDEKRWGNSHSYARRSMAATRATGKAYRLAFGWIMAIAGYETTPADEMPVPESQEDKIYEGTNEQKLKLYKLLKENNLTSADLQKKIHADLLESKAKMSELSFVIDIFLKEQGYETRTH